MSTSAVALVTLVLTVIALPLVRVAMNKLAIVDTPAARTSHSGVIPRGGGIALMLAMVVGLVLSGPTRALGIVAAGAVVLGLVGLVDDRLDLSVRTRLVGQLAVAGAVSSSIVVGASMSVVAVVSAIVATGCLVGYVNAFNFMDGINGISAAQAIAAGGAFIVLGMLRESDELTVGGALLVAGFVGFLPFNAPKAVIFLGDVGSYFAGFWIGGLVLLAIRGGAPIETALVPVVLWLTDTSFTLLVRLRNGERIGEAHSDHAYQRLARAWHSHAMVSALAALTIGATSAVAVLLQDAAAPARVAVFGLVVATSIGLVLLARRSEPAHVGRAA